MKNFIVLSIIMLLLTGCGGGIAKFFSKLTLKFASKSTIVSTNKHTFNPGFLRSPSVWKCASKKVQHRNCNESN